MSNGKMLDPVSVYLRSKYYTNRRTPLISRRGKI